MPPPQPPLPPRKCVAVAFIVERLYSPQGLTSRCRVDTSIRFTPHLHYSSPPCSFLYFTTFYCEGGYGRRRRRHPSLTHTQSKDQNPIFFFNIFFFLSIKNIKYKSSVCKYRSSRRRRRRRRKRSRVFSS